MFLRTVVVITALLAGVSVVAARAQRPDAFGQSRDHPAIAYSSGPVTDQVSALNERLRSGAARLAFDPETGYLRGALDALGIAVDSQVLVFSQTSSQAAMIDKSNPRAVYFSDTAAIGWVRRGSVLELAAQDPRQGTIFYTLHQSSTATPQFQRDNNCLRCHLSWDTRAVPGPLVLTTHPRKNEREYASGGAVDHREPIRNRWGGWFVTGSRVPARHMGNRAMLHPDAADPEHTPPAPKLASVGGQFDAQGYPSPHSDIVALLVLEHQAHLTNLLTRAGWEARYAAYDVGSPSRAGEGAAADDARGARVRGAVDEMVDYMLFVDEVAL
ncbi:MAG: hypothetical protein LC791_18700, partial [Acidobacteria bacterium]|nr:hypothetical protein [Acidobacteriota bacterium]